MKWILFFTGILLFAHSYSQSASSYQIDTSSASIQYWNDWYKNLYQNGVDIKKDSFVVSPEFKKLGNDSNYRQIVYPAIYTWQGARDLLSNMELKKAFWYMIKLYRADTANKRMVIGCLSAYNNSLDVEKAVTSSFYTYAFLDPTVATIKNNKPVFTRPDILESELNDVKQMILYVRMLKNSQPSTAENQTSR